MKVKGSTIMDLVRILRASKEKDFSQYLEPEDWDIINDQVMNTQWYPGDSYWRIAYAVSQVTGKNDMDNIYNFGRLAAQSRLKLYKRLLVPGDPAASLEKYNGFWEAFYDFEDKPFKRQQIENNGNHIHIKAYDYPDMIIPEMRKIYFYGLAGAYQEVAEQALGKKVEANVTDKGDHFEMDYTWP